MQLPERPALEPAVRGRVERVTHATASHPSRELAGLIADELRVDLTTRYGGVEIPHPIGKASGQLSCTLPQVEDDVAAGLAFVVLKTVIAETPEGDRAMDAWAVDERQMTVERRVSAAGREGWTVTWSGRGWSGDLDAYVEFYRKAVDLGRAAGVPVAASVKYHLPAAGEPFRTAEYDHTTGRLLDAWRAAGGDGPMLLEKDFSPTLAGDDLARAEDDVLRWVGDVPALVERAGQGRVALGLKLMNALADDALQVAMLERASQATPAPAYLVVFNRLYDPSRGVAYGGWDLSDRNLAVLDRAPALDTLPPLSATGNICSGRMMLEYALRGCENGQVHTFFQIPRREYTGSGPRSGAALHTLLLAPESGLVPWLLHLRQHGALAPVDGVIRFRDVVGRGRP